MEWGVSRSADRSDERGLADWLKGHGVRVDGVALFEELCTAQGFVTTDRDHCQIWAFYEGATAHAHKARVEDLSEDISFAIVSANGKQAMMATSAAKATLSNDVEMIAVRRQIVPAFSRSPAP